MRLVILKRIFVFVFIFQVVKVFSQKDTLYYKNIENKDMFITASLHRNLFGMVLNNSQTKNVTYFLPNQIANIGVSVSHPILPFEISLGTGVGGVSEKYPKTKSLDIQIHKYARHFVLDAFYQKYTGFYTDRYKSLAVDHPLLNERIYPDLKNILIGVSGQYVFNHKKFSYPSAFNRVNEVQLKSAGSILAGFSVYYFKLKSSKKIIDHFKEMRELQYGFNGGYAYNFVLSPKWSLNASGSLGLNLDENFNVKPNYLVRASSFYTHKKWTFGAFAVNNILTIFKRRGLLTTFNTGLVNLQVTRRFVLNKKK